MFTMTEAAGARLADKLAKRDAGMDVALRVVREPERRRWALRIDKPDPSDDTYTHDGRVVLVLDQGCSHALRNRSLDVRQTAEGPRLRLLSA